MPDNNPWWTGIDQTDPRFASLAASHSGPAYDRVTSIPSWLPTERTQELTDTYNNVGNMFSTDSFDKTSKGQESRILTSGLNAGNNAATDYANRARQAGGSGMGAGLVKAEASVGAQKSAGEIALDREKFDASQREKAAGLSAQIASTLGNLRDSYLKSIVGYATQEDSISADYKSKQDSLNASMFSAAASRPSQGWTATIPNGMGTAGGIRAEGFTSNRGYVAPPSGWSPGQSWNPLGHG